MDERDMETEEINAMCAVVDIYIMHSGNTGPAWRNVRKGFLEEVISEFCSLNTEVRGENHLESLAWAEEQRHKTAQCVWEKFQTISGV